MSSIDFPPGFRAGCLPRRSRYGDICAPFADQIKVIPREKWAGMIGEISLREKVEIVFDQNGYGSCATESSTQSDQVCRAAIGLPFVQLNPLFVYHTTSGGGDNGSNIDDNLVFLREKGVAPESIWPRSKGFRATPSKEAYAEALKYRIVEFFDIASWEEFGTALLLGFPVVFGYSGHSILATELIDETTLEYVNSWGDWGDKGFGRLKSSSIMWQYGAWAVRSVVVPGVNVPIAV